MSLGHGSSIVRNGLHFSVDFSNLKSVQSLSLTDISGNGIPITITNPSDNTLQVTNGYAQFSPSTEGGSATFYTISDSSFNTIKNEITLETAVYITSLTSGGTRIVSPRIVEGGYPLGFGVNASTLSVEVNTDTGWKTGVASGAGIGTNTWIYVTQTTSVIDNSFKTYVNGELRNTISLGGSIPTGGGGLLIGRGFYGGIRNATGRVGFVRVYSRALTSTEIQQNFNALRGRYGI